MARPQKPADEVRSQVLQLRLTVDERATMESGAERAGEQLSQFIRNAALEKAAKGLATGGRVKRAPKE